jgi:hypothetical protein
MVVLVVYLTSLVLALYSSLQSTLVADIDKYIGDRPMEYIDKLRFLCKSTFRILRESHPILK